MKEEHRELLRDVSKVMKRDLECRGGKKEERALEKFLVQKIIPKNFFTLTDSNMESLYNQAYTLYKSGRYKDAKQVFHILTVLDPREPKYSLGMAGALHMMKEYEFASQMYMISALLDPLNPIPYYHTADCYINMEDVMGAITSLQMAVKRAGDKPEFRILKERCLAMLEKQKKELNTHKGKGTNTPHKTKNKNKKVKKTKARRPKNG